MRKTTIVLIAVFMLLLSSFGAQARDKDDIEISLSSDEALTNRLFNVSVTSSDIDEIAGGEFTLCYDNSVLEFGKVNSENFEVKCRTYDDAVKIVFAVDKALCENENLFNVQFKAKNEIKTDIELVSSYVVDRNLDVVPVSAMCDVIVNKKETKNRADINDSAETSVESSENATADNQNVKLESSDNKNMIKYIVGGIVLVVAVSINVWFLIRKRIR